jgi:hypothetical protein
LGTRRGRGGARHEDQSWRGVIINAMADRIPQRWDVLPLVEEDWEGLA